MSSQANWIISPAWYSEWIQGNTRTEKSLVYWQGLAVSAFCARKSGQLPHRVNELLYQLWVLCLLQQSTLLITFPFYVHAFLCLHSLNAQCRISTELQIFGSSYGTKRVLQTYILEIFWKQIIMSTKEQQHEKYSFWPAGMFCRNAASTNQANLHFKSGLRHACLPEPL